jgi:hypothetical protein
MQIIKGSQKSGLVVSLCVMGFVYFLANLLQQEKYPIIEQSVYPTDVFFIVVSPITVIFASVLVARHRFTGSHAKAWILFLAGSITWYAADLTYYYNSEYIAQNNNSYLVDYLYYSSYFLYFGFMIFYLKPRKNKISKKMIMLGAIISMAFIAPSLYFIAQKGDAGEETGINMIYPFLDSMVFVPAFVGVILFFRGEVNFLWMVIILGIICMAVADTLFLIERCLELFSPSSMVNLFFAWKWILFGFGAYNHIKIFGATSLAKQ